MATRSRYATGAFFSIAMASSTVSLAAPTVVKVLDFPSETCGDSETYLGEIGQSVYFVRGSSVWVSNGTGAGTKAIAHVSIAASGDPKGVEGPSVGLGGAAANGMLLFSEVLREGSSTYKPNHNLWFVSPSGAVDRTWSGRVFITFTIGAKRFFVSEDNLYETDGTQAGTTLVTKLIAPSDGGYYSQTSDYYASPISASSVVLVRENRGGYAEKFLTDGTAAGTRQVGKSTFAYIDTAVEPRVMGDFLYVRPRSGLALGRLDLASPDWTTNTVFSPLEPIESIFPPVHDRLAFSTARYSYVTNGTNLGTLPFARRIWASVTLGDNLIFAEKVSDARSRLTLNLYKTDLTEAGTVRLAEGGRTDLDAALVTERLLIRPTTINKRTYFTFDDGTHGFELWSTDGTVSGTTLVSDLAQGAASAQIAWIKGSPAFGGAWLSAQTATLACSLYRIVDDAPSVTVDASTPPDPSAAALPSLEPSSDGCTCSNAPGAGLGNGVGGLVALTAAFATLMRRRKVKCL